MLRTRAPAPSSSRLFRLHGSTALVAGLMGAAAALACGDDPSPEPGAPAARDEAGAAPVADGSAAVEEAAPADAGACAADVPAPGELPRALGCTGLVVPGTTALAPGVVAYTPAIAFWSDGTTKARHLYLPPGTRIDTTDPDNWVFPNGTRAWKEFALDGKKVETRLLAKDATGTWRAAVYRWNAAGTDATRLDDGEVVPYRDAGYAIPAVNACDACHAGKADTLLGVEAVSLGLPGAAGVTLETLARDGRLSAPPAATSLALPDDATGLARPAVAWLHGNCGNTCHNDSPRAGARFVNDFRMRVKVAELVGPSAVASAGALELATSTVGKPTTRAIGELGVLPRLDPGNPDGSGLVVLAGTRVDGEGSNQMPPLVSRHVDTAGLGAVRAWTAALPPPLSAS